jgi:hypothetical protein
MSAGGLIITSGRRANQLQVFEVRTYPRSETTPSQEFLHKCLDCTGELHTYCDPKRQIRLVDCS